MSISVLLCGVVGISAASCLCSQILQHFSIKSIMLSYAYNVIL